MNDDIAKAAPSTSKLTKVIFLVICIIIFGLMYWSWQYSDAHPSTEDAYVRANILSVAPQIRGQVSAVEIQDFQQVNKGDLLFKIDPSPYILAVKQAEAAY